MMIFANVAAEVGRLYAKSVTKPVTNGKSEKKLSTVIT